MKTTTEKELERLRLYEDIRVLNNFQKHLNDFLRNHLEHLHLETHLILTSDFIMQIYGVMVAIDVAVSKILTRGAK